VDLQAEDLQAMNPGDAAAEGALNRQFKVGASVRLQAFRHADMLNGPERSTHGTDIG